MHIHKRVVTERCGRVYEVKNDDLIALLLQQIPGLTQNLGFRVCNYHRAGTFQYIRHTIGARFACTGAADNEDVGVMLVFVAIYPDVKMLGQQQVRSSLIHVELIQAEHVTPSRRAMLRAGAGVLLIRHSHDKHYRVNHRKHKQKARAVLTPRQRKRLCQCAVQRIQQSRYFHARLPAASHRQCCPPYNRQRQQPDPPRVLSSRRGRLPFFAAMVQARSLFCIPRQPLLPKFGQSAGNVRA